LRVRGLLK